MIDWIYCDPVRTGSRSGVTRGYQKFLEGTKTIVDASNRFRVVSNVVCDDFVQSGKLLGVERVPSRLAATRGASPSSQVREHGHPAAGLEPSHEVAKSYGKILWKSQNPMTGLTARCWLDGRVDEPGCSGRRHEAPQGARGLALHPGVSHNA